jgi:Ig-like domain-containing protein
MSSMKTTRVCVAARNLSVSLLLLVLSLSAIGCGGGYGNSGGGGGGGATAPYITTQPANQTVTVGQRATFSVVASGTAPLNYQWQKNGADISGATSSSYMTPATTTSDNGATFKVAVSNSAGSVTSGAATLTVTTLANASSWTYVQDSIDTFCKAGATSCTIQTGTFLPTVTGSIWAVLLTTNNNVTITSVTGGGGTWTLCPNCHIFNATLSRNEDIAYNLTGNAGTTSITVNLSGAASGQFGLNFVEVIPPPASIASFDDAGTFATASCTICTGVGLNITATDVIIQSVAATSPSTWNAWSAPYTTLPLGEGLNLNATSGAAPTVVTTGPGAVFSAIAFKSTAGSFAPPTQTISVVSYTAPQGINCSPSCSLSIPATGSGHLLYIEAADMTSSHISSISGGGSWIVPTGSNTCQIMLSGSDALSCGYVLSSTAGVSSLSVTMSGNTNASFAIWELASASGPFSFDVEGSASNNPSFAPPGVALALSGSNDVIFQSAFVPGGTSSVSYYPMPRVPPGGQGTMFLNANAASVVLLNTTNGNAPLWVNQQNNATVVSAVAFSTP